MYSYRRRNYGPSRAQRVSYARSSTRPTYRRRYYGTAPKVSIGRGFKGVYTRPSVEKKFVDSGFTTNVDDSNPGVLPINVINEGTSVSQRIGRKVCIKSVQIRGSLWMNNGSPIAAGARLMLVWDKQANGVLATVPEIIGAVGDPYAFMNLDNRERFVVLMDKQYTFFAAGTSGVAPVVANIKKYKNLPPTSYTIYDGTGAGIADISTGALLMVLVSDAQNGLSVCTPDLRMRIRYTDA